MDNESSAVIYKHMRETVAIYFKSISTYKARDVATNVTCVSMACISPYVRMGTLIPPIISGLGGLHLTS